MTVFSQCPPKIMMSSLSYTSAEQKKQKVSEIKSGIDEAESLVPTLVLGGIDIHYFVFSVLTGMFVNFVSDSENGS